MRRILPRIALLLVGALAATMVPLAPASAEKPAPPLTQAKDRPDKSDQDRNKLFDDFEAELAGKRDDARVAAIVALHETASEERVRDLERRVGAMAVSHRYRIVDAFAATITKGQAKALARQPDVAHVEADSPVRATNDSAQAAFGVSAARASVPGLDGSGVSVSVIDTGVATSHGDLAGKVTAFRDFVNSLEQPYDDHGHGTHVAATVAGTGAGNPAMSGTAPGASLLAAKVLDANGSGSMSNVTAAVDWSVAEGANVINLSLGASGCADGTDATSKAIDNAAASGVVVAVAAGNEGPGTCTVGSPGAAAGAITVAAMSDLEQLGFHVARFSSRGRLGSTGAALKPDVAAPGVAIASADAFDAAGYTVLSGTSMATPFVAGVAALMLQNGAAPAAVKTTMESTALDWGASGDDVDFGAGRLDAYRAITGGTDGTSLPGHAFRKNTMSGTGARVDYQVQVTDLAHPIAATLLHPSVSGATSTNPDFDLYLFDPAGVELARGYTASRQETVAVRPNVAGTYILRVQSYSGSGDYHLDVSAGGTVSTPAVKVTTTVAPSSLSPVGDPARLKADDNAYYAVRSTTSGSTSTTSWVATFANVPGDVTAMTVSYKGKNSRKCSQTIAVSKSGTWSQIDSRSVGTSEVGVTKALSGTASSYVGADGTVNVRVQCSTRYGFTAYGDLLSLKYDRWVS